MTEVEKQAPWGEREHQARLNDIASAKRGEITLDDAKRRAEMRRREVGLSVGQAAELVSDHVRSMRWSQAKFKQAQP